MSKADNLASLLNSSGLLESDDIGTDAITASKLNIGQIGGRRNLIINGAMQVAQRGTTVSGGTGSSSYGLDRFIFEGTDYPITTQVTHSNSQITDGNRNALKISTTGTAIGTAQVSQRIERETFRHTIGQTVTFSCLVKRNSSNVTGGTLRMIASVNLNNPYVLRGLESNFPSHTVTETLVTGVQNIPTDYTRYTASFTMPAGANTTDILEIGLSFFEFTGAGATEDLFSISEMQLELGDTATPFEHRSYGEELALCQRYYQKYSIIDATSVFFSGVAVTASQVRASIRAYGGLMRDEPSIYVPTTVNVKGNGSSVAVISVAASSSEGGGHAFNFNVATNAIDLDHVYYITGREDGGAFELDAEL